MDKVINAESFRLCRVNKMFGLQSERSGVPPLSITFTRAGKLPVPITFTRAGKLPVPITFTRGKARLLCTNLHCYARTSGAAAHERRFPTSADTPLAVRFTAIVSKFTSSFFYQALPHLMQCLCRAA